MEINVDKSSFLYNNIDEAIRQQISNIMPYKMEPISAGFKYMGYHLNPLGYGIKDWRWFLLKFEKRLNNWTYKLLSLGGRLVLVKSILTSLAVYWLTLARMPSSILNHIKRYIFNFLWGCSQGKQRYHLADWSTISRPYALRGWNIKNIEWFSLALRTKSLWLVLNGTGLWSHTIKSKYLKNLPVDVWLRQQSFKV